jgi:hypothetical protein
MVAAPPFRCKGGRLGRDATSSLDHSFSGWGNNTPSWSSCGNTKTRRHNKNFAFCPDHRRRRPSIRGRSKGGQLFLLPDHHPFNREPEGFITMSSTRGQIPTRNSAYTHFQSRLFGSWRRLRGGNGSPPSFSPCMPHRGTLQQG